MATARPRQEFLKRRPGYLQKLFSLQLGVSRQQEGGSVVDGLKDASKVAAWQTSTVFFSASQERYIPSAEPAARKLSSGRSPQSNPSSVSHNPRRAAVGHPSIS